MINPIQVGKKVGRRLELSLFVIRHRRTFPALRDFSRWDDPVKRELHTAYEAYVSTISTSRMAISLEACYLLYFLCTKLRPRIVVDLGSGLSSYVFRLFKAKEATDTVVYSVDDNLEWLEATSKLLVTYNLSTDNLVGWSEFRNMDPPVQADLILHDLSIPKLRIITVPEVMKFARKTTLLIFDDMHRSSLRRTVMQLIRQNGMSYHELRAQTLDQFGRFQWCVFFQLKGNS